MTNSNFELVILTFEDETSTLCRNVGNRLYNDGASYLQKNGIASCNCCNAKRSYLIECYTPTNALSVQ